MGLYQGARDEARRINEYLPADVKTADAIVLSHGHLDHCGKLPVATRAGFKGPIYCTPATAEVARVVLNDSAMIQMENIEYLNRRSQRTGADAACIRPRISPRAWPHAKNSLRPKNRSWQRRQLHAFRRRAYSRFGVCFDRMERRRPIAIAPLHRRCRPIQHADPSRSPADPRSRGIPHHRKHLRQRQARPDGGSRPAVSRRREILHRAQEPAAAPQLCRRPHANGALVYPAIHSGKTNPRNPDLRRQPDGRGDQQNPQPVPRELRQAHARGYRHATISSACPASHSPHQSRTASGSTPSPALA